MFKLSYYDFINNRNDAEFTFARPIDNVAGYTTQQCFNALQPDVRTVPLSETDCYYKTPNNPNGSQANVNALFMEYHTYRAL